jgi:di/tricarboxylate transporter
MSPEPPVDFKARNISGLAAFVVVILVLLGPITLYRAIAGIPWDAQGPEWGVWLLVASGVIGAGLGRYVHIYLMTRVFGFTEKQERKTWGR